MAKSRKQKRGGSGLGLRIPSSVVKTLRLMRNRNKPKLPTKLKNIHPNLTNNNVKNVYVVNTNTNEWRINPGEGNRYVPKNLRYVPQPQQVLEAGPGVRIFKSKR